MPFYMWADFICSLAVLIALLIGGYDDYSD